MFTSPIVALFIKSDIVYTDGVNNSFVGRHTPIRIRTGER